MIVGYSPSETEVVDLLDRVLDKGVVIDAWGRLAVAGIDFGVRGEARMVVASIDTRLTYAGVPVIQLGHSNCPH